MEQGNALQKSPCDSFLWGYLKSKIAESFHNLTIETLKELIVDEIADLDINNRQKISNGVNAFKANIVKCLNKEGGHITAGQ